MSEYAQRFEFRLRQGAALINARQELTRLKAYMSSPCYEELDAARQEWVREQIVVEEKRLQYLTAWKHHFDASRSKS